MNNQNLMMKKEPQAGGTPEYVDPKLLKADAPPDFSAYQAGINMVPRGTVQPAPAPVQGALEEAPEKQIGTGAAAKPPAKKQDAAAQAAERLKAQTAKAVQAAGKNPGQPPAKPAPAKPAAQGQAPAAKKPAAAAPSAPKPVPGKPITLQRTPDELCKLYITAFKDSLGLDLSSSICFENMRRFCECDTKNPDKALFFMENTYRLSTVLYLAANLPIIVIASILAEKNRKNILKYVATEVENGAKPYEDLKALRIRRWGRKYESMGPNDAPTVTPGLTGISKPMYSAIEAALKDVSIKLKRFNKELTEIVGRFDDTARNDVVYIYSNWWYLLQGFENVPEMRSYIMAITDDTRKNLKV